MLKHWPTILYSVIRDESNQQPKDMISDPLCVSVLGKKGPSHRDSRSHRSIAGGRTARDEGERELSPSCTFCF